MRFIELHEEGTGDLILVNVSQIISIGTERLNPDGAQITHFDGYINVRENPDEIKRKIYG